MPSRRKEEVCSGGRRRRRADGYREGWRWGRLLAHASKAQRDGHQGHAPLRQRAHLKHEWRGKAGELHKHRDEAKGQRRGGIAGEPDIVLSRMGLLLGWQQRLEPHAVVAHEL